MRYRSTYLTHSLLFHQFALVLSGIAGLGYQLVWVRQFAVGLGHEMPSMLAVVAGFFAGLALGAWALDRLITSSRYPARWYVALELIIGCWALLSIPLIGWLVARAPEWIGVTPSTWRHWSLAFTVPLLGLLPATVAMGATLPAMERLATLAKPKFRLVGGLYAANTAGAVIGTLGSTYWLMPLLGHRPTVMILASINIGVAILVALPHWNSRVIEAAEPNQTNKAVTGNAPPVNKHYLFVLLFVTGLLGIGYEVLAVRVMSQVVEGTVYSFAALLSVYLIGTTIGAALYQRYFKGHDFTAMLTRLLSGVALAGLAGILALYHSPAIYRYARLMLGDSMVAVLFSESLVALSVLVLPSIIMGATLSHLLQAARGSQGGIGHALAVNTLGGALAPGLIGVALLTAVGANWALAILVIAYLWLLPANAKRWWSIPGFTVLTILVLPKDEHLLKLREGESILTYREGVLASVAVVERNGARNLRVNNRYQMGGTSTTAMLIQRPQTHIPLLLHKDPEKVLFLGVASGVTTGAATLYPELTIDAVELVPESLQLLHWFDPANRAIYDNANVNLYSADARRFVRSTASQYDVIIADLFQPGRDGAGLLYTLEHFEAVHKRLRPEGLFAQWLPFYQLDTESIRIIVSTFQKIFPHSIAFLASNDIQYPAVALIGSKQALSYAKGYFKKRVARASQLQQELSRILLNDELRLFGQLLFDQDQLTTLAANASVNTDDHPHLMYQAPRFTYRRDALSYGRLIPFIDQLGIAQSQLISGQDQQLASYMKARNIYLNGMTVHLSDGVEAALSHYKKATLVSKDFTSSYAQLVNLALKDIKSGSPKRGRDILEWLDEHRPEIPAANQLIRRMNEKE